MTSEYIVLILQSSAANTTTISPMKWSELLYQETHFFLCGFAMTDNSSRTCPHYYSRTLLYTHRNLVGMDLFISYRSEAVTLTKRPTGFVNHQNTAMFIRQTLKEHMILNHAKDLSVKALVPLTTLNRKD